MKKWVVMSIVASAMTMTSLDVSAARVMTNWFKIQEMGADGNGPTLIIAPPGIADNCTDKTLQWAVGISEVTQEGYQSATSIALTAFLAEREIRVEYENATSSCYAYKVRMQPLGSPLETGL